MIRRINECTNRGIFTIFDPGQAMGIFTGEELKDMVAKSDISIMNEPERAQFETMTSEDFVHISEANGHTAIVTLAEKGAEIRSNGSGITIPAIYVDTIVDATGCGDAFRSGLLLGLSHGWNIEKCVKLGNILGGIKISFMG